MVDLAEEITEQLPLRIESLDLSGDELILSGSNWGLKIGCPWRCKHSGSFWFSWSEQRAADLISTLQDQSIVSIRMIEGGTDPAFLLSNGTELQLFADTDYDPWVLRTPRTLYVGIASPPGIQ